MGTFYNPKIITDGLVLHLDAGNKKSYVEGSSTWYDISKNKLNGGSLINGPVYNTNNLGSIDFDGINDYTSFQNSIFNRSGTSSITVDTWIKPKKLGGTYQIIAGNRSAFGVYNWMLYQHTNGGRLSFHGANQYMSSYIPQTGIWIHCVATVSSNYNIININSIPVYSGSYSYANYSPSYLYIASTVGSTEFYKGEIASIKIYDKALSANEVLQNFNATKGRFGL